MPPLRRHKTPPPLLQRQTPDRSGRVPHLRGLLARCRRTAPDSSREDTSRGPGPDRPVRHFQRCHPLSLPPADRGPKTATLTHHWVSRTRCLYNPSLSSEDSQVPKPLRKAYCRTRYSCLEIVVMALA